MKGDNGEDEMHTLLEQIKGELIAVAQVVASNGEQRPLSIAHSQWGMAGVDRDELAARAQHLADWIDATGPDDMPGNSEAKLSQYPPRLQYLRSATVPQIFNGNAQTAVPAYLITLDGLEQLLRPVLAVNDDELREAARSLRNLQRKVRSLTAQSAAVEPKIESLQTMASEIVRAHDAADRLPTDLEALVEARGKMEALVSSASTRSVELDGIMNGSESVNRQLSVSAEEAEKIIAQCESAMRASTTVGLAGAFHDRAESLRTSLWPWVIGLIGALAAGAYVGGSQLHQLSETIQATTAPTIVWTRIAVSVLSVGAPVWFAWLATKQIGQRFRLSEDYAYKASISKAYEGYRREAAQLDEDFQKRLFASALTRLDEQPLRFVEQHTHGSPFHEFLASDVVKDAIHLAPQLLGEWKQRATETVAAARARRKMPANAANDEAASEQG